MRMNVPLDGDIQVGDVMKDKVREGLVTLFADEFDEGLRGQLFTEFERRQTVLRKRIVELIDRWTASLSSTQGHVDALDMYATYPSSPGVRAVLIP